MTAATESVLSDDQLQQWHDRGYFIVRNVIDRDEAMEIRGVLRNRILTPDVETRRDEVDPSDPMGNSPEARQARLRKLSNFCISSPLIWHTVHANRRVLDYARAFLGDDLLNKFNACFLKPARTGSATPWHQDNGLWRDGETEPFNLWMAIDPATRENGCMQFIPGSHKGEIVEHVVYEDSLHPELPRDQIQPTIDRLGLDHIELDTGDMVCWHSSLWHYSPPNHSDHSRIAVAGVYSNPRLAERAQRFRTLHWCMKSGEVCDDFPPQPYVVGDGETLSPPPAPRADGGGVDAGAAAGY